MSLPDNIIIFGRSGSGKGTQARLLREKLDFEILDTGGLLREMSEENGKLGRKIKETLNQGYLVPDWVLFFVVVNFLRHFPSEKGLILEGSPRKLNEAEALDEIFEWIGRPRTLAILIDISSKEATRRLMNRRICSVCGEPVLPDREAPAAFCGRCGGKLVRRKDDEPAAIEERLEFFENEVAPVIGRYNEKGLLHRVNGAQFVGNVFQDVYKIIEEYNDK